MKKFVLKVIGITLLAIFAAVSLASAAIMIFAPQVLASYYDKVGNYDRATNYMYARYRASGDTGDLIKTCKYAIKTGDSEKQVKYLSILVGDEGFYDHCAKDGSAGVETYDFLCGKYVVSAYESGKDKADTAKRADELTKTYSSACALRALVFTCVQKADAETLAILKGYLEVAATKDADNPILNKDITMLGEYSAG